MKPAIRPSIGNICHKQIMSSELIWLVFFVLMGSVRCWECDPASPNASANIMCFTDGSCVAGQQLLRSGVFSEDEKSATLHFHNMIRQLVASGQLEFHPSAAHLPQVVWDDTVARAAAKYAAQCTNNNDANRAIYFYADANSDQYLMLNYLQTRTAFPYYKYMVHAIFGSVCEKEVKLHHAGKANITLEDSSIVWTQLIYENFTRMGCGFSEFNQQSDDTEKMSMTLFVCLYAKILPSVGKYVYTPGNPKCEVDSKIYPSLCASDEINAKSVTKVCADSRFALKYELLCSRINPLWFCNEQNFEELEEELGFAESSNWLSITLWVIFGFLLPLITSIMAWCFWEEVKDRIFDFFIDFVSCR